MVAKLVNIVNVSSDIGSIYAGKSKAPAAFKSAGLQDKLRAIGYQVEEQDAFQQSPAEWVSSTREPNGARNEARTVEACHQVSKTIASALDGADRLPFQLILAGECLYCPAIMSAYWHHLSSTSKRVGIIYVDADCDLHTPTEPGSSGTIAGMTLTHLTLDFARGALESMSALSRPDGTGVVDKDNIVLFGLNTDSEANKRDHLGYLFDNEFRVFTSRSVQRDPIGRAKAALSWLEERVDHIIVHLDVDVIDPGQFPLCNVPNWTGLGFEETMAAVKIFLKSDKAVALSVAEVNPDHDPRLKMTESLVDKIVDALS
ncbi:Arginase/deacetylase [Myriangium duriaei CBS 260.36]|uniref:Arginase/deacetylase n=1 Tax=Myriangium duriaei CBS 260.36 TaxID=1168546 RepID=A0A9P4MGH9_9PEZI|nr:Arginase/deacetylase [Myriangium duriaei CBS 260.36]